MSAAPAVNPSRMGSPLAFWLGVTVISVGVGLIFAEFLELRATGEAYHLTTLMALGLALDVVGTAVAALGVLPRGLWAHWRSRSEAAPEPSAPPSPPASSSALSAMDNAPMTRTHWAMMGRMYIGLVIDTMKPATLGFVLPGLKASYGLTPAEASLYPLTALVGTTIGSIVFGLLGDVVGRRASFIFTALLFATTAPCGFMPSYSWNLVTCFLMGLAAGGELPVIYTLLAETMPARHRGWMAVAVGGFGGLSGYLVASLLAAVLEPVFTWRVLWLLNLPTALIMLGLLRWVPESPRFLLHIGLPEEARRVMAEVGVQHHGHEGSDAPMERRGILELVQGRLLGVTVTLCLFGFAWGLCNWGFITWLPSMLRDLGLDAAFASRLLALSALCAMPGTLVAAFLYGRWSSKWTAVLTAGLTALFLLLFWLAAPVLAGRSDLVVALVIGLLVSSSSMIGVLAPYSVELYPTALRGVGSGVVAASSKSGGIVGPLLVGALLGLGSTLALPALVIGLPLGLSAVMMAVRGTETRGRTLEQLSGLAEEG